MPAPTTSEVQDYARGVANAKGLPVDVFLGMLYQESRFNTQAVSPKGAVGVGQLMPGTAADLGVDPYDWRQNIEGAGTYFGKLLDKFGDPVQAVAAYNAGPNRIQSVLDGVKSLPAETQDYIDKIFGKLKDYSDQNRRDIAKSVGQSDEDTPDGKKGLFQRLNEFFSVNTGKRFLGILLGIILITAAVFVIASGSKTVQTVVSKAALAA